MKIAIVRARYNPLGGAERFVARAIGALAGRDAEITVVARSWPRTADGESNPASARLLRCDPFHIGGLWRDISFSRCACKRTRTGFDLVQSHERIPCCDIFRAGDGVHRVWLAERLRLLGPGAKPRLFLNPHHLYTLAAEKRLFHSPQLKAVICNSAMVREEILAHFPIAADKLHIIYNGIDIKRFHPGLREEHRHTMRRKLGLNEEIPVFLLVGSGFERKGVERAIHALPAGAALVVVGTDKRMKQYQTLAKDRQVFFAGGQNDVRPYYGLADAFVLPTLYDPFPNAALEAMASALPVITSRKSGAAEFVGSECGAVVDSLDIPGLAKAMRHYTSIPNAIQAGRAARARVEPHTLEAMSRELVDLYEKLLEKSQRGLA